MRKYTHFTLPDKERCLQTTSKFEYRHKRDKNHREKNTSAIYQSQRIVYERKGKNESQITSKEGQNEFYDFRNLYI